MQDRGEEEWVWVGFAVGAVSKGSRDRDRLLSGMGGAGGGERRWERVLDDERWAGESVYIV